MSVLAVDNKVPYESADASSWLVNDLTFLEVISGGGNVVCTVFMSSGGNAWHHSVQCCRTWALTPKNLDDLIRILHSPCVWVRDVGTIYLTPGISRILCSRKDMASCGIPWNFITYESLSILLFSRIKEAKVVALVRFNE